MENQVSNQITTGQPIVGPGKDGMRVGHQGFFTEPLPPGHSMDYVQDRDNYHNELDDCWSSNEYHTQETIEVIVNGDIFVPVAEFAPVMDLPYQEVAEDPSSFKFDAPPAQWHNQREIQVKTAMNFIDGRFHGTMHGGLCLMEFLYSEIQHLDIEKLVRQFGELTNVVYIGGNENGLFLLVYIGHFTDKASYKARWAIIRSALFAFFQMRPDPCLSIIPAQHGLGFVRGFKWNRYFPEKSLQPWLYFRKELFRMAEDGFRTSRIDS